MLLKAYPKSSIDDRTWNSSRKVLMKPLFNFVSDNGPFLMIGGVVVSMAASLLLYTAAYLHH